jgi:hypothetical protein
MNLSLDGEKSHLNRGDVIIVFCSWMTIFFAWILTWDISFVAGLCSLACSVLTFCYAVGRNFWSAYKNHLRWNKIIDESCIIPEVHALAAVASRNLICSIVIIVMMPLFPVAYFARFSGLVSDDTCYFATSILNYSAKVLFVHFVMDGHLEVSLLLFFAFSLWHINFKYITC